MAVFSELDDASRKELWAILALRHTRGIGPRRAAGLVDAYGSAHAAVEAGLRSPRAWPERKLLPAETARAFHNEEWRKNAQKDWQSLRSANCAFLLRNDPDFPALLRQIPDPPLLLYLLGDSALLRSPSIAVVGARDCTREGLAVAAYLARDLSNAGVTVISGMARGIDRAAHLAALSGPGKSVAVLGTGTDVPYPPCNADLYAELAREGLLVSEFAPGTPPSARHFPIRNRIISGLSLGVLVVEAAARSGSLITARLALEQNREVFAVPGHTMAAVSEGCRALIRKGARATFTADDILAELAPQLSAAARAALDKRREEERKTGQNPARRRGEELDTRLLDRAVDVLPGGGLPWEAPRTTAKPGKHAAPDKAHPAARKIRSKKAASGSAGDRSAPGIPQASSAPPPSAEESRILSVLGKDAIHIDELGRRLGIEAGRLSSMLTLLEVQGRVKRAPGMLYSLPGG